jgi:hypothetical protein
MAGAWRLKKGILAAGAALIGRGASVPSAGGTAACACAGGVAKEAAALRREGL